jgi:hypothetical protein
MLPQKSHGGFLVLPRSGRQTILQLMFWACGTYPSTLWWKVCVCNRRRLSPSQSVWSHQLGDTGQFSASKLTELYRTSSVLN